MGPNTILGTFLQPITKNCCCNGQNCQSFFDIDSQNRFASIWEDFDKLNKNIFDDFSSSFATSGFSDKNISTTPVQFDRNWDLDSTTLQNTSIGNQGRINNEKDRLEMVFDTNGFDKEDLKISRKGQVLTVEGKHIEKSSDDSKYVSKQFSRSYTLPAYCNMEMMKSSLSNDNTLNISIPKNIAELDTGIVRQVPIEFSDKKGPFSAKSSSQSKSEGEKKMKAALLETLLEEGTKTPSTQTRNVTISVENDPASTKKSSILNKETENQVKPASLFNSGANTNSTHTRNVAISVENPEISPKEKSKFNDSEKKSQCEQTKTSLIRPILLFNQDDSIFHTNLESRFKDRWNNMMQDQSNATNFTREIEVNKDDSKELNLTFDLKDYKPDELKVTVMDNVLKIEAKHEENTDGNHISRQFVRSYVLPNEYKAKEVQSSLSKSGKLTVIVPKQCLTEKTGLKNIPIKME